MSFEECVVLYFAIFLAANLVMVVLAFKLPSMMNERMRRSLELVERERLGREKRYIVHSNGMSRKETWVFLASIIFGSFMLSLSAIAPPPDTGNLPADMVVLWMEGGMINLFMAYLVPVIVILGYLSNSFNILFAVDGGFEEWYIERKKVRFFRTMKWSDIKKVEVGTTRHRPSAVIVRMITDYDSPTMLTSWKNASLLWKDLSVHNYMAIQTISQRNKEGIELQLKYWAERAEGVTQASQGQAENGAERNVSSKSSKSMIMFGAGNLVFWTMFVLIVSFLEIDVPIVLIALPFLGCIGLIFWGFMRMRKKMDSTL